MMLLIKATIIPFSSFKNHYIEFILIRLFAIDYFLRLNLKCFRYESNSNRQWHGWIQVL